MNAITPIAMRKKSQAVLLVLALVATLVALSPPQARADETSYKINAGGAALAGGAWEADQKSAPSVYNNAAGGQDQTFFDATDVTVDGSVPAGTPVNMFKAFRWDPTGAPELQWDFPVADPGIYDVRLYFAEIDDAITAAGERVFDVSVEGGAFALSDFDVYAEAGNAVDVGIMRGDILPISDGNVDVDLTHGTANNPIISGIEILTIVHTSSDVTDLSAAVGGSDTGTVTVTNASDSAVTLESTGIAGDPGFSDDFSDSDTAIAAGDSLDIAVTFDAPGTAGTTTGTLDITVDGDTISVALQGEANPIDLSPDPFELEAEINDLAVGTVTLSNNGSGEVTLESTVITGANAGSFSDDFGDTDTVIPAGGSLDIEVTFEAPGSVGGVEASLDVTVDGAIFSANLSGTATAVDEPDSDFIDIGDSIFQTEIKWLADEGITRGCNPPVNDEFCPTDFVTRGQMAAFLHRALDDVLTPGDPVSFVDDDDSIFEADIEWLGATGVTRGCNPPVNDEFCPTDFVTRGQMAAFLHRALDDVLTPGDPVSFVDDDDSIFEADIEWLGATGVTRGCNPPVNDEFCPTDFVTREQMAAFLYRALAS